MWFGYVPQIKNTNVISARGPPLFSFSLLCDRYHCHPPWFRSSRSHVAPSISPSSSPPIFSPFSPLSYRHSCFPRLHRERSVSTPMHVQTHTSTYTRVYTRALAYKLLFLETRREQQERKDNAAVGGGGSGEVRKNAGEESGRGDGAIRAGRSVCSVKLSLRGSSPANLWDTYNASQEYCSVCRPSTLYLPSSRPVTFTRPACAADALATDAFRAARRRSYLPLTVY